MYARGGRERTEQCKNWGKKEKRNALNELSRAGGFSAAASAKLLVGANLAAGFYCESLAVCVDEP